MISRAVIRYMGCGIVLAGALFALQRPFRQFPGREYGDFPLPPDWGEQGEWTFARLMYPPSPYFRGGFRGRYGGGYPWQQGLSSWTTDYPRSDRHLIQAM